jgi:hypothetical protein
MYFIQQLPCLRPACLWRQVKSIIFGLENLHVAKKLFEDCRIWFALGVGPAWKCGLSLPTPKMSPDIFPNTSISTRAVILNKQLWKFCIPAKSYINRISKMCSSPFMAEKVSNLLHLKGVNWSFVQSNSKLHTQNLWFMLRNILIFFLT